MKVYQYKHYETLITGSCNENEAAWYNNICKELLLTKNVSDKKFFQHFNLRNNRITSLPHIVMPLLQKNELPPFRFLICKN